MATETESLVSTWFNPTLQRISFENDVTFYVKGVDAFSAIADALVSPDVDDGSYVLLLGWSCQMDFRLKAVDPKSTLRELFKTVDSRGASIRAMLWASWYQGPFENGPGVLFIKKLTQGDAILDNRTAVAGSHHQKLLMIYGKTTTVAFCGGMDIFPDRVEEKGFGPLHDVHCKLVGRACEELVTIFIERWNDHPEHRRKYRHDLAMPVRPHPAALSGTHGVQVGRTYPRITESDYNIMASAYNLLVGRVPPNVKVPPIGNMKDGLAFKPYAFSRGEQGAWTMIEHGIATAKKFIYVEDQYLVSRTASAALANKLRANIKDKAFRIIILICHTSMVDLEQAWQRRKEFINDLSTADPTMTMWSICYRTPIDGLGSYVHSKTWIFDDSLAIVGSANCSRRSYTEDSECDIAVVGQRGTYPPSAQLLRCALWAKHLGGQPPDWFDPMKTARAWFTPPPRSNIARYIPQAGKDARSPPFPVDDDEYETIHDMYWQDIVDPDGS